MSSECGGLVISRVPWRWDIGLEYRRQFYSDFMHGSFVLAGERFPPPCLIQRKHVTAAEEETILERRINLEPISVGQYLKIRFGYVEVPEWIIFIPYWLLLSCIALSWVSLLFWRARRRKRRMVTVE